MLIGSVYYRSHTCHLTYFLTTDCGHPSLSATITLHEGLVQLALSQTAGLLPQCLHLHLPLFLLITYLLQRALAAIKPAITFMTCEFVLILAIKGAVVITLLLLRYDFLDLTALVEAINVLVVLVMRCLNVESVTRVADMHLILLLRPTIPSIPALQLIILR